jgi:DNA-binding transcriptional LysR family regulator
MMGRKPANRADAFELRHLRYFTTLVDERNFERAAARLGIAQPGLSQQIMALEQIVGMPLLDRTRRSVKLTTPGQLLYEDARKILANAEATLAALKRVDRGETGRISIGYVASAAYSGLMIQSIASFRASHPDVELQLIEMEMRLQLAKIADGNLDFAFIRPPAPVPEGVTTHVVLREPLVAALPENHPLAFALQVDLKNLADETFITPRRPPDVGFHYNTIEACNEAGFQPTISPEGRDYTTITSMVAIGLGVALVPRSLDCLRLPGVRYVPLAASATTSDLAIAHRKTEASPAVRAFILHTRN